VKRRMIGALAWVAVALVAGACASTMTVSSHVDRALDISPYKTFDWGPADAVPTGDPRLDRDPFFKDEVQGAVEKQLAAQGIVLAPSGQPDLLVHYHANVARRIDVNRVDSSYGYCAAGECPAAMEYEAGTLVLDVIDARTNRLIWRGWAQRSVEDVLDDRDRMARLIREAVSRMLQRFPRAL
jgi:hypothetical protein